MLSRLIRRRVIYPTTVVLLVAVIILDSFYAIDWYWYALIVLSWFLVTLSGSFFIQWNFHLTSYHSNKKTPHNWVAITFDDGPDPEFTPQVLDLLKKYSAKATFFCIGEKIEAHSSILERIIAEGHTIGNPTFTHSRSFGFFGVEEVKNELQKAKETVQRLSGRTMDLYRPAFGVTNPSIEKVVEELQLKSIGWNVRSLDTTPRSENMVYNRIVSKVAKGDIILLHDTSSKSVAVLERLLVFLNDEKLQSVTVDQLLEIRAYV